MTLPYHPYADLFPLIEGEEFLSLVADMKTNGLLERIVLLDRMILDGRNRYRAAIAAGLIREDDGPDHGKHFVDLLAAGGGEVDPLKFVLSKNLHRRQLNDDQRRMVSGRLANLSRGRPSENPAECGIKVAEAARLLNVDPAGTERARTVLAQASAPIQAAVDGGKLTVAAAAQAAKLAPELQETIAHAAMDGNANAARTIIKQEARAVREKVLGVCQQALPNKKYGVVVADPEWRFEPWSRTTGMDRAADNHYPTSCTDVIAARDVSSIAAKDCVLFLWATAPMLPHALLVMAAWGFDYKSQCIWIKDRIGTGYWFRNKHELLLVGTRGSVPAPAMGTQWESAQGPIAVRGHSEKPDDFLMMVERYFPTFPKIELNRRGLARPGWDAWGNEAELPPHDPDTGEIIQSTRVPQCSSEASSGVAPQGEAPHAGIGSEMLAGCEGRTAGRGANTPATVLDDGLSIPDFLKRTAGERA